MAKEPTVQEIARIIGRSDSDLSDACKEECQYDGGTCICEELYHKAAIAIQARFREAFHA